ncbi:hypothetical protein EcWSU1_00229 [Enterobacter ludwigii]|uniref:Uncharacterized protein n=1 Tax=Enterobacter ludwigii TaxID=299767 RepID=G8LHF8_9ENTR|nr:hypothetical protein EcWSU1_00229 [Enterobacter ludwigii]
MPLTALNMFGCPGFKLRLNGLPFAGGYRAIGMPAPLAQHNASLTQRIAGLADLFGTITIERDLIAGKLLFLTADFPLHKAQLAMVIKTHFHMFGGLAVDIQFYQRQVIALPAILRSRRIAVMPRTESRKQMHFAARIFAPDPHRTLVVSVAAGGKRWQRGVVATGGQKHHARQREKTTPDRQKGRCRPFVKTVHCHASYLTASFSALPETNAGTLAAAILISLPVCGLRPVRSARWFTLKVPKPTSCTASPSFRDSVIAARVDSRAALACTLDRSALSAITSIS